MFTRSVLVTGSNRGIGLELVKQLASKTQHLFATCRNPTKALELQEIDDTHSNVKLIELDVKREDMIVSAVASIAETVGENGLNCIINNAGSVVHENLETMNIDSLKYIYAINAIGPALIVQKCLPLLRKASSLQTDKRMSIQRASILNISSIVGLLQDSSAGRNYSYRMSKAALNILTKNLSLELKRDRILAVSMHPGWVQTDMGGPNALIDTTTCVEGILKVASELTARDTGLFFAYNGQKIPT